jgi:hypothetical protein
MGHFLDVYDEMFLSVEAEIWGIARCVVQQ